MINIIKSNLHDNLDLKNQRLFKKILQIKIKSLIYCTPYHGYSYLIGRNNDDGYYNYDW